MNYSGIDLHSNNSVVSVIDDARRDFINGNSRASVPLPGAYFVSAICVVVMAKVVGVSASDKVTKGGQAVRT